MNSFCNTVFVIVMQIKLVVVVVVVVFVVVVSSQKNGLGFLSAPMPEEIILAGLLTCLDHERF